MELLKNYKKELKKIEDLKNLEDSNEKRIKKILHNNNIKYSLFIDTIDTICEIINKYKGKKLGEKTKEKIQEEIQEKFNNEIFCYLSNSEYYPRNTIHITTRDDTKKYNGITKIEITPKLIENNFINKNNEIQEIEKDFFIEHTARIYTNNIERTTQQIIQKHEKAKQLQNEINKISIEIHELSNYCIDCVKYTNTVL